MKHPKYRTLRIVLAVSVFDNDPPDVNFDAEFIDRVAEAILPHPDSRIATARAGESVTVLITGSEVTS